MKYDYSMLIIIIKEIIYPKIIPKISIVYNFVFPRISAIPYIISIQPKIGNTKYDINVNKILSDVGLSKSLR